MGIVRLLGLSAICVIVVLPCPSYGLPPSEVETFYLDDNGQVVGFFFRGCDGSRLIDGQVTSTTIRYSSRCQNPPAVTLDCRWQGSYSSCVENMFWDLCTDLYSEELCSLS